MSKAFDNINIHTPIRKLLQTNISGAIIKFIANYINGRKAYTIYRNPTSRKRQFKPAFFLRTLFNIYTSDLLPPRAPVQVMAYAYDITIASTHTRRVQQNKYIESYLRHVFAWTKQNNFILNPEKITCTMFPQDPEEYTSNLDLKITTMHYPWQRTQSLWVLR